MKNAIKHFTLLLTVIAVIMIGSCRKDKTSSAQAIDFRDSLVGSYACTTINDYGWPNIYFVDTVRDTMVVIKCQSNDSAIVMNGDTFRFSDTWLSFVNPGIQFIGSINCINCVNGVSFTFAPNDSTIQWINGNETDSASVNSFTNGRKIH